MLITERFIKLFHNYGYSLNIHSLFINVSITYYKIGQGNVHRFPNVSYNLKLHMLITRIAMAKVFRQLCSGKAGSRKTC